MPKRQSDKDRVLAYFKSASQTEVQATMEIITHVLDARFPGTAQVTRKKRGPNRPKTEVAGA